MDGREFKVYERWKDEAQSLRAQNQHLRLELMACRPALYRADQKIDRLEQRVAKLWAENRRLKQRVRELTLTSQRASEEPKRGGGGEGGGRSPAAQDAGSQGRPCPGAAADAGPHRCASASRLAQR